MKTKCEYSGTLFIISRKYFSVFRGPHLPLDTPFWTRCFPLVMQSRIVDCSSIYKESLDRGPREDCPARGQCLALCRQVCG